MDVCGRCVQGASIRGYAGYVQCERCGRSDTCAIVPDPPGSGAHSQDVLCTCNRNTETSRGPRDGLLYCVDCGGVVPTRLLQPSRVYCGCNNRERTVVQQDDGLYTCLHCGGVVSDTTEEGFLAQVGQGCPISNEELLKPWTEPEDKPAKEPPPEPQTAWQRLLSEDED